MPRATALLGALALGLVTVVIIATEIIRQMICVIYKGGGCAGSNDLPGLGLVVAICAAIGAVSALVGGINGRRIALLVGGVGLVLMATWSLLVQWCCREFLPQAATMTGLFLVATIVLWHRVWPRWVLVLMAIATLAMVTPYAARTVETGQRITQPQQTAQPAPEPGQTSSP